MQARWIYAFIKLFKQIVTENTGDWLYLADPGIATVTTQDSTNVDTVLLSLIKPFFLFLTVPHNFIKVKAAQCNLRLICCFAKIVFTPSGLSSILIFS